MSLIYGQFLYGRYIWLGNKYGIGRSKEPSYRPGVAQIIAYDKSGQKTAIFGNDIEDSPFSSCTFEIADTGSGACTITFKQLPKVTELTYGQRIDIHLYGDYRPWYSGYVLTIPPCGGTAKEFKVTAHGYYNILKNVLIFEEYENKEVSEIVKSLLQRAEGKTGIKYNPSKVELVNYTISRIKFDGVTAQEAIKQLSEFAQDYVFGVDEYQDAYFKPRNDAINEEARLWVGTHINGFEPTINVDKIVNYARIKGAANSEEKNEVWLATVEDTGSQQVYGRREAVWTLPTAYSAEDAQRWGQSELNKYKEPIKSAKIKDLMIEYPKQDRFWVRKLNTEGKALIYDSNGKSSAYPITKIKYTLSADKGIKADLELGEPPFSLDKYLFNITRNARNTELLEQAARGE